MARIELEDAWHCEAPLEDIKKRLDSFRMREGMRPSGESGSTLSYKMGSQVATRLIGGWMGKKRWLPTRATITLEASANDTRVVAHIEEALDVGILDRKLKRKYEQQFATRMAELEAALHGD